MGRPLKQGLDYFPLDVDFLQDIKVRKIAKAQGLRSIPVLICLLSNIYRTDGYYLRWDGDMPFLIAEESGVEEGVVTEVLSKAQKVGFFDAEIFDTYGVLTSRGIQKRYFLAVKTAKRKEITIVENFLLINPSDVPKNAVRCHAITVSKNGNLSIKIVNSGGNSIDDGGNPVNSVSNAQSKVKEREKERERKGEERERKGEERKSPPATSSPVPLPVLNAYQENIRPVCNGIELERLADDTERYGEAAVIKAIERAVIRGKRNIAYVEGILKRWESDGYDEEKAVSQGGENAQMELARRAMEILKEGVR